MMIVSNTCFEKMLEGFTKMKRLIVAPSHVGLGKLPVCGKGILSMTEADVNTEKLFLDMHKAEKDGHFGKDLLIWKYEEWWMLIGMLASGLHLSGAEWDNLRYHPTMWHSDGETRSKATESPVARIEKLRERAGVPSDLVAHLKTQPHFRACDVFSVTSGATTPDSTASLDDDYAKLAEDTLKGDCLGQLEDCQGRRSEDRLGHGRALRQMLENH